MSEFRARSVVVTGGSRGIGRAICERMAADGHKVASFARGGEEGTVRRARSLDVTVQGDGARGTVPEADHRENQCFPGGVLPVTCDITDADAVEAAFATAEKENGPVEILVANAGITHDALILRMGDAEWQSVLDVNLTGAFRVAKRAARSMVRGKWGRIVFIGSVVGSYGSAGQVNYAATKAALVGMARSLTRELGSRGITANVVAPGFIETDMTAVLPEQAVARYRAAIPAGRMGQPADVAAAVAYLTGEEAGFVSGAVLPVDGGMGMGH